MAAYDGKSNVNGLSKVSDEQECYMLLIDPLLWESINRLNQQINSVSVCDHSDMTTTATFKASGVPLDFNATYIERIN